MTINTLAISIAATLGGIGLVVFLRAMIRMCLAMRRSRCARCGFRREGLPDANAVCPECGSMPTIRSRVVRTLASIAIAFLLIASVCAWLIAEWTIGPVLSTRVALVTNRPLNEELQERLLKHLPKGYADDVVPTIKANSAANAMMRYALRQRVESTDPALQQRAYILLNHVAKSYAGGREMVANHAIKRAWDDAVAHDIVLACNIRRSITWDEIPEYLQTEDPVYVILSDIGDPAIREEAIQALFSMPRGSYTQHANRTEAESYAAFAQVTNTVWLHLQEHCHLASLPHFEKDEQSIVFLRHSPKLSKDQMRVVIDTCLEQNTDASYLTMLYYATKMKNYTKDRLLVNELSVRIDGATGIPQRTTEVAREYLYVISPTCEFVEPVSEYVALLDTIPDDIAKMDPDMRDRIAELAIKWAEKQDFYFGRGAYQEGEMSHFEVVISLCNKTFEDFTYLNQLKSLLPEKNR